MIKVTSDGLRTASSQLVAGGADVDARLGQLRAGVSGLVADGWQGSASTAFDVLYQQWNTAAASLRDALDGISRQLASAADMYDRTESAITRQLRG